MPRCPRVHYGQIFFLFSRMEQAIERASEGKFEFPARPEYHFGPALSEESQPRPLNKRSIAVKFLKGSMTPRND